jgi:uncharacterized membrane protein YccC
VNFTHGNDAARYALARALYTILGVAVGLLVSRFVWPIRGRDEITAAIDRALTAIAAVLEAPGSGHGAGCAAAQAGAGARRAHGHSHRAAERERGSASCASSRSS